MKNDTYQYGFSASHPDVTYNVKMREQKAKKIIAVLDDHYSGNLESLTLLDIGCSTGIITNVLSKRFHKVTGIDIDEPAVKDAKKNYQSPNLGFSIQDSMKLGFPGESFHVIVCAHIYEHVPDPYQLLSEIYRVLKHGGICYFAAGNRINLIEPHYKLPLLSVIPKSIAHQYLHFFRKGDLYYENHLTLWGLRRLVSRFEIIDYTLKIVENPEKYFATEMIQQNSYKQNIGLWILKHFYWASTTYLWLLRKKVNEDNL
ncbi:MAG: hypothetical protein A2161_06425 [Candidatus Schekmanbacteria bacterium RBG_13_48_7]|uniref:Methyltransferase type 11 domain-containing protein n=1 Tax=Candidatus Schekmanbacteria bacterium RBG_13_48_7 TaxID=1817878 RepID=A0A1F7RSX1_9BACT|nr:MAG: hypothetical protein A2161_06425 [Candidatus Schekmanbacteria bacterium RBG_13_48_7]